MEDPRFKNHLSYLVDLYFLPIAISIIVVAD